MVAIYARQSVDKADSISVDCQLAYCAHEAHGRLCKEYIDRGFSGKNTLRPAFGALMRDVRAGVIETVIVYKLDRVSRSVLDFAKMMEEFAKYEVDFVSATEKFDTQTPMGRAMLNIATVFAQLERETIQKRVLDSCAARSERGFYMGGRIPYGFRLEPFLLDGIHTSRYVAEAAEAAQIRLLYTLYAAAGASLGAVARYFEAHELRHLRGGKWNSARIGELLRNPVYVMADMEIYRYFRAQGVNIVGEPAEFIGTNGCYLHHAKDTDARLVLAPHEGLVPASLWLACRQKCAENKRLGTLVQKKGSWLSGILKCGRCGYALTVKKSGDATRYFVCSGRYTGIRCGGAGTLRADAIEEYLGARVAEKLRELAPPRPASARERDCRAALMRLQTTAQSLLTLGQTTNTAAQGYIGEQLNELAAQREILQSRLRTMTADASPDAAEFPFAARWDAATPTEKGALADALLRVVRIADGKIELTWRL